MSLRIKQLRNRSYRLPKDDVERGVTGDDRIDGKEIMETTRWHAFRQRRHRPLGLICH